MNYYDEVNSYVKKVEIGKAKKTGNIEKFNKKFGLDKEQN